MISPIRTARAASPEDDFITTLRNRTLLADIGGTNARFAILAGGEIGPVAHIAVADHGDIISAIAAFLAGPGGPAAIDSAVLGVAGKVEHGRCEITNSHWLVDTARLQAQFGLRSVCLLNDFEALAWALPHFAAPDLHILKDAVALPGAPMLVLGPGTGFGAACFMPAGGGGPLAIATEAGHATLPASSRQEDAVVDHLRRQFEHVSVERALSGDGLQNLYSAIAAVEGAIVPPRNAAAITEAAKAGRCEVSRAALDMFCALLGTVAGDLALTFCARGGVYIAGGIVPRFPGELARSEFHARFAAKGRYRAYLDAIPIAVITRDDSAFVGLKAFAQDERARSAQRASSSP